MRIGPVGIINRAFPALFSRTSGVPGVSLSNVLVLRSPTFLTRRLFRTFQRSTLKRREQPLRLGRPWEGRGCREPTEPVSVADCLSSAPHREFEEGTALALMFPVLVRSGCPVSRPTRVPTFIVWRPM